MKTDTGVHFVDKYLLSPTNPVVVNLIGAGATGSQVLTGLSKINHSLRALSHPGLFVRVIDNDVISDINTKNQLYAEAEVGLPKSVALINRVNRFFGTNWKAINTAFLPGEIDPAEQRANITITCVDKAKVRLTIGEMLNKLENNKPSMNRPMYWMDFGNSQVTGQVLLGTLGAIRQPESETFLTRSTLPTVAEEFGNYLNEVDDTDMPSCSHQEALDKQDLFINAGLCSFGCSLLYNMFRQGMLNYRGFFVNIEKFKTEPIKI